MNKPPAKTNPSLEELRKIRQELHTIKNDLQQISSKVSKPVNLIDQIAKGVMLAGVGWLVLFFILQLFLIQL